MTTTGPFVLDPLPWAKNALVPHISEETIDFHYGKHHAGYVTKLNAAVQKIDGFNKKLEELIKEGPSGQFGSCFNNAAQIWNHTFYWNSMSPNGGGPPTGTIATKINQDFGSFEKFKEEFSAAAGGHFGSGWAWLVLGQNNKLEIAQTHDAGNPLQDNKKPILTCDVWEHAYYIDYRNARPEYIKAWWNVINWEFANQNLAQCSL